MSDPLRYMFVNISGLPICGKTKNWYCVSQWICLFCSYASYCCDYIFSSQRIPLIFTHIRQTCATSVVAIVKKRKFNGLSDKCLTDVIVFFQCRVLCVYAITWTKNDLLFVGPREYISGNDIKTRNSYVALENGIWNVAAVCSNFNVVSVAYETGGISSERKLFFTVLFNQITKSHMCNTNFCYRLVFRFFVIIVVPFPLRKPNICSLCISIYLSIQRIVYPYCSRTNYPKGNEPTH